MDDFFAPPAFKPEEALTGLQRSLRALGLSAQGTGFSWQGRRVAEIAVADGVIQARVARRPAMQPEFEMVTLKGGADVRKWLDDIKKRLDRWSDAE